MASGISVVIFPEGTRSLDGRLLPFKRGGFLLAVKTGTPIVPVTINGSRHILPKSAWRLRPGIVEVDISEPIPTTGLRPGTVRALADQVQKAIEKNLVSRDTAASQFMDRAQAPAVQRSTSEA
jgi:1-acyl-sn-glycerol-3-phosphate acyltransferase